MRTRPRTPERDRAAAEDREPVREPAPEIAQMLRLQAGVGNAAVVRLMRSPNDQERWEEDWNTPAYADSQNKFKGEGRPAGEPRDRYFALAPLYKAHGIDRPLQWAHQNIHQATFFGSKTPAHDQLTTALAAAEADLIGQGHKDKPFRSCWAFNPRTTSAGGWSNHADGKAIDIDADQNPHLTNLRQKKIINALTGMDVTAENPGEGMGKSTYEAIEEMSQRFQDRFSPEGMQQRIEELEAEEEQFAAEEAELKAEIAGLPKKKKGRLTEEERKAAAEVAKQSKDLTARLKLKHAQALKAQERQDLLESEIKRYDKVHAEAEKQRAKIAELLREIEELENQIDELQARIDLLERPIDPHEDGGPVMLDKHAKAAIAAAAKERRAEVRKLTKSREGVKKAVKAKHKAIAKAESQIDDIHRWGSDGFMDLEPALVTALQKAGLEWGGEWAGSKDFMHFEVK
jgi:hypothetical protein